MDRQMGQSPIGRCWCVGGIVAGILERKSEPPPITFLCVLCPHVSLRCRMSIGWGLTWTTICRCRNMTSFPWQVSSRNEKDTLAPFGFLQSLQSTRFSSGGSSCLSAYRLLLPHGHSPLTHFVEGRWLICFFFGGPFHSLTFLCWSSSLLCSWRIFFYIPPTLTKASNLNRTPEKPQAERSTSKESLLPLFSAVCSCVAYVDLFQQILPFFVSTNHHNFDHDDDDDDPPAESNHASSLFLFHSRVVPVSGLAWLFFRVVLFQDHWAPTSFYDGLVLCRADNVGHEAGRDFIEQQQSPGSGKGHHYRRRRRSFV